jgi:hypothetical protein
MNYSILYHDDNSSCKEYTKKDALIIIYFLFGIIFLLFVLSLIKYISLWTYNECSCCANFLWKFALLSEALLLILTISLWQDRHVLNSV